VVHHGIWRDLIMHIGKQSLEEIEDGSRKWSFPASAGAIKHEEWEMREILAHIGLLVHTQEGRSAVGNDITQFHYEMGYWNDDECNDVTPEDFLKVRPDGVAFNAKVKVCVFFEFTRPMDLRDGISKQPVSIFVLVSIVESILTLRRLPSKMEITDW